MELELLRLRRVPKMKTSFFVDVRIDGVEHRARARIFPRRGHALTFAEGSATSLILSSGRKLRPLCTAIVAAYRGEKLRFPVTIEDQLIPRARPLLLTIPPSKKPLPLAGVG